MLAFRVPVAFLPADRPQFLMPSEFDAFLDSRLAPAADQLNRRARRFATLSSRLTKAAAGGDMRSVEATVRDLQAAAVEESLGDAAAAAGEFDYRKYLAQGFAADFETAC